MSDLWSRLQSCGKTIVMYGTGNGADKILEVCSACGIEISDFFASDGFVRERSFHGKRVLGYAEVCEKYDDFIVLLSFASSLPDVIENIMKIASEHELYAPDVPVSGGGCFNREYYEAHAGELARARELLADDLSKEIFDDIIEYKLSGRLEPLMRATGDSEAVLSLKSYKYCVDCGAYNGDTARSLLGKCPELVRVLSLEPDRRNFKKLAAFAEGEPRVTALNCAAWSCEDVLMLNAQGNRNSSIAENGEPVRASGVDILTREYKIEQVDFIKYDVEGAEREALSGSVQTIRSCRPELLVSAYHRNRDLFDLPALVHEILPGYRLYLRRGVYIPAWDINLCAVL